MFFLQADKENCAALKSILRKYKHVSGQSINKDKSAISFFRKAPASLKTMVKDVLQIQSEGGVEKYLGFARTLREA